LEYGNSVRGEYLESPDIYVVFYICAVSSVVARCHGPALSWSVQEEEEEGRWQGEGRQGKERWKEKEIETVTLLCLVTLLPSLTLT